MKRRILVTGAGGFIGHHLCNFLKDRLHWVRGVDLKHPEFQPTRCDEFLIADLRQPHTTKWSPLSVLMDGIDDVFALAADMGGMGFISQNHATILRNNLLINLNTIEAAKNAKVERYVFSSSACVYPEYRQTEINVAALQEHEAYPAQPQDAYGWEKLITERLCQHYREDYGFGAQSVRFHNIFGQLGTWYGGREKAPAALCRKIALAKKHGTRQIEIWGDGNQTRSFCHVSDCVEGLYRFLLSGFPGPLNLGQDRMVSINELADMIAAIAEVEIEKVHVPGPEGVRGRNSDNSLLKGILDWEPKMSLEQGLEETYEWIEQQVFAA